VVSYQDLRTKHFHQKFIYRIFYENAKKAKPKNEIYLSDIRKHNLTVFSQGKDILQIFKVWITIEFSGAVTISTQPIYLSQRGKISFSFFSFTALHRLTAVDLSHNLADAMVLVLPKKSVPRCGSTEYNSSAILG